nr:Fic family protein [uncultured Methanoregula sp.]
MDDLTVEEILALHAGIMARDGGDDRVLSEANLHQAVFHVNLQPDPFARAATIVYLLCAFKAFREGNKRTAQAVAGRILADAGYKIKPDDSRCIALMQGVIDFIVETDEIEAYFHEVTGAG